VIPIDNRPENKIPPGRFSKIWIVFFLMPLILIGLLNYIVDPYGIYGTGLFKPLELNSYTEKAILLREFDPKPEALIIGSSRVGQVDPIVVEELTGYRCFNFGVPSVTAGLMNSIVQYAVEDCDAPIRLVIVGVDPETFDAKLDIHQQAKLSPFFNEYFDTSDAWQRVLTFEQTISSIEVIARELKNSSGEIPDLYRPDGFSMYTLKQEMVDDGTFDLDSVISDRLENYASKFQVITPSTTISEEAKTSWLEFLEWCSERDIDVYFFMPPAHPRYIEMLGDMGSIERFREISTFLEMSAERYNLTFRDFTDLDSIDGDPGMFWDEVHMQKHNHDLVLRELLGGYPENEQGKSE